MAERSPYAGMEHVTAEMLRLLKPKDVVVSGLRSYATTAMGGVTIRSGVFQTQRMCKKYGPPGWNGPERTTP